MTDRELMQMALDALENAHANEPIWKTPIKEAIEALRARLAQPEPEPLEYWNAVEGWVKIDEVRQHFDKAGCGTIYKTSGEGRVPLYTKPPKPEPTLPGGGGGSGVLTIDGWPLYSVLSTQEEQGLTATPLPAIKLQDERESQYKSFAQSAQVIGMPKKEWVELSDEEICIVIEASQITLKNYCSEDKQIEYARAIETMIKDKNYD